MKVIKESPLLLIVILPSLYLGYIWNDLPKKVPIHWNINGEIDRYGSKSELLLIPFLLPLLIYLIFLIVPHIDPKKKIQQMGSKYQTLKVILTTFMSVLALYILYSVKNESVSNPNTLFLLIGLLFFVLGNYFKTIKANYFIGIRTPWTLENEKIWKETHQLGGKLWFVGGLLIVAASLILEKSTTAIFFITVTVLISFIPIVYSYLLFRRYKNEEQV